MPARWFPSFVVCCALVLPAASHARVLLIGIDGGAWRTLDPMIAKGELPHLASLIERGVSANMATVEPVTSPVVWTSIATGRSPAAHGVTDFFNTRGSIQVPSIYERLAAAGYRVGLYDMLMTWPPAPLPNGFSVPGWLRRDENTWPADALDTSNAPLFRTVYQGKPSNRDYLDQQLREVSEKANSWKVLRDRFDPQLGALTFYCVDSASHRYWHASYPEDFDDDFDEPAEDEKFAVQNALRGVDAEIGKLLKGLAPEDSVIVVSDHGFQAHDDATDIWITRVEDALAEFDLNPERDGFSIVGTFFAVTLRVAPGEFDERDELIEKLTGFLESYTTVDGTKLLWTSALDVRERPADKQRPWTNRAYQWAVRTGAQMLFDVQADPTAQAILFGFPRADLLGELWPDGEVLRGERKLPLHEAIYRQRFTGDHHPTAIAIVAGGPIAERAERDEMTVLEIAPLIAYLMGSAIPDDLEGELLERWIDPEYLAANPPQRVPATDLPGLPDAADGADGSNDPALIEKLRALGYVD